MKAFIIHNKNCSERLSCVENIVSLTGAEIVEPVWCPTFPVIGCILSHIGVAELGEGGYYVFEDDCDVINDKFMETQIEADIVYFGINGRCFQTKPIYCEHKWGTHAMYISEKARKVLLENWTRELEFLYPKGFPAFDEILSVLALRHGLTVRVYDFIKQKKGFVSYISGNVRG